MSGTYGYDPVRLAVLKRSALDAIFELRAIRCADPEAAPAIAAARQLAASLEDSLMPAILAIERHDPLVRALARIGDLRSEWQATSRWLGDRPGVPPHLLAMTDDELIAGARDLQRSWPLERDGSFAVGADRFDAMFVVEASREIARRAATDPEFIDRLIAGAGDSDSLGLIASFGHLRADHIVAITRRLVRERPAGPGEPRRRRRAHVLSRLFAAVARSGRASHDLLGDEMVQLELVDRFDLDDEVVAELVAMGTAGVLLDHPELRASSRDLLLDFARRADRGAFPPGLSRGLALGLAPMASDLARTLDRGNALLDEHGEPLVHGGRPVAYRDVAGLVGRIAADGPAQGTLMSIVAHDLDERVRSGLDSKLALPRSSSGSFPLGLRVHVEPSVRLIELFFVDAIALEQSRLVELHERSRSMSARAFDVVTSLVSLAPGGRSALRIVKAGLAIGAFVGVSGRSRPERIPTSTVPAEADGIVAGEVLRQTAARPDASRAAGFDGLSRSGRDALDEFTDRPADHPMYSRDGLVAGLRLDDGDAAIVRRFLAAVTGTDAAVDLAG